VVWKLCSVLTAPAVGLLGVALLVLGCCAEPVGLSSEIQEVSILSYNVENLFDDVSDGTEYPGYDPGRDNWTTELFERKLENIAAVIEAAVPGGPDIMGLQEIENGHALSRLVESHLSRLGYTELVMAPAPDAAVHVALVSRFPVTSVRSHMVSAPDIAPHRSILEVRLDAGGTPLVVFVNHWKSKFGGGGAHTEPERISAATLLSLRIREILDAEPTLPIVVLGDLNLSYDEYRRVDGAYQTALIRLSDDYPPDYGTSSIFLTGDLNRSGPIDQKLVLYTPWKEGNYLGSYSYQGSWETIDHVLLGPNFGNGRGLDYEEFSVVAPSFALSTRGTPQRWDTERRTGYSDHLPLLLRLKHYN
jgi:endonuclease/exonuclease/phosphatase family metal-dependent hydrolase